MTTVELVILMILLCLVTDRLIRAICHASVLLSSSDSLFLFVLKPELVVTRKKIQRMRAVEIALAVLTSGLIALCIASFLGNQLPRWMWGVVAAFVLLSMVIVNMTMATSRFAE